MTVRARSHRVTRLIDLSGVDPSAGNLDHGDARFLEPLDILPLMRQPPLDQRLQNRIPNLGFV